MRHFDALNTVTNTCSDDLHDLNDDEQLEEEQSVAVMEQESEEVDAVTVEEEEVDDVPTVVVDAIEKEDAPAVRPEVLPSLRKRIWKRRFKLP